MKLYLDTNILFFMLQRKKDEIDSTTRDMLYDYANQLHTSIVCVAELMQLVETRDSKVRKQKNNGKEYVSVTEFLNENNIAIESLNVNHLRTLERLPLLEGHHDVIDRLIIAQAITDKATLVSSDLKFPLYCKFGLEFHKNKR
ncbi:MAG: PIN domain-containing protein [Prevotella sp.]|nr:PIN domain-containing protein [Prevotella sp.]